ncbi:class I SAM-dependent methyltransferase [Amycolatopsis sp. NPDC059021]|uniref:class I SAM-dependent methyltransferase n=1 Tax=Amycolatopsis sp. NPDC059021 TaxID=3346704 RepID=UPI003670FC6D
MTAEACALCGGQDYDVHWSLPIGKVLACRACSLVRMVDPRTGRAVRVAYDENYYRRDAAGATVGYPDYFGAEAPARRANAAVFARLVTTVLPGVGDALDIGCGGGYLVNALAERGVDATGVDGSAFAVERARALSRGRFARLMIQDAAFERLGRYSMVTIMDVIEHLTDPVAALAAAARRVTTGGVLMLLTPRYGGRLLAGQGAAYVHFNTDHVHYFTRETLENAIEAAMGFERLTVAGVMEFITEHRVPFGPGFREKYGTDRDSMLAVVRSPSARAHEPRAQT